MKLDVGRYPLTYERLNCKTFRIALQRSLMQYVRLFKIYRYVINPTNRGFTGVTDN